ncbi:GDSL-type esterase/lipase family protein [Arthrobacter sp. zg-Y1143]|uniref:GDSL-type esterase/lipase family protein n=1 Tax=Arthrobacter sp. zg-Y1143 TaxID=3049065 RepID=UPI0024C38094|nr:GDSL-type esterase/lipase family protein [Arthrobacter sp. zg-Y1143]MDK1327929.1 GDSL-type esterase/lipase family protein [Arthrobacter sp. zg-Y1143]
MVQPEARAASSSTELVFSFGTLSDEQLQRSLFGHRVNMVEDSLVGHGTTEVVITDTDVIAKSGKKVHPGLIRREGDTVPGWLLALSPDELAAADAYEVDSYVRRRVSTGTRGQAWCYVSANPLNAAERIALIGDSIAYGRCTPDGGWAARVAARHITRDEVNNRFFNLAWPGATILEALDAAEAEATARRADTVLVAAGLNDLLHADGRDGAQVRHDVITALEAFCEAMELHGRRVVVMSPNWVDTTVMPSLRLDDILDLRETLRSWCERTFRDFLDTWDILADQPTLLSDGIHPTAEGYRLLAEAVAERSLEGVWL